MNYAAHICVSTFVVQGVIQLAGVQGWRGHLVGMAALLYFLQSMTAPGAFVALCSSLLRHFPELVLMIVSYGRAGISLRM